MTVRQLEFDFGFDAQTEQPAKKKKKEFKKTTAADFKPGTDNHKIKVLEAQFFTGDKNALVGIYHRVYFLADKYIHSESRRLRFYIAREDVLEKCNDIALYILQRYLEDKDFQLKMPSAYVWRRVMRALYYRNWTDNHVTFTDKL